MTEQQNPFGRALTERSAALYLDRSMSWLCNGRRSDVKRIVEGELPMFPKHIQQGRNIFYLKEDLDAWLDSFKQPGGHPAWAEDYEQNTRGLKYQPEQAA